MQRIHLGESLTGIGDLDALAQQTGHIQLSCCFSIIVLMMVVMVVMVMMLVLGLLIFMIVIYFLFNRMV